MTDKVNKALPVKDEELDEVSGGTGREAEVYCPNCGRVTRSFPLSGSLIICTVCSNKHNGDRIIGLPRA